MGDQIIVLLNLKTRGHYTGNEGVFLRSHVLMAVFGNIGEFLESKESWSQYAERFEQFFAANDIAIDTNKSVFLATIGLQYIGQPGCSTETGG